MKIAVLSGKGGTGKTLVSVNLAAVAGDCDYIDCDVEEPNGRLFFKPEKIIRKDVTIEIPVVNHDQCIGCKKCVEFCKFNAIAYINKVMVFENICHSCGGCMLVSPENAITKKEKVVGEIEMGKSMDVNVFSGVLNPGEPLGTPIIAALLENAKDSTRDIIIDCPPGSSCTVMDSIRDADYCVLVAEPTIFGAHNSNMVYELVTLFKKPFGVVLNKTSDGINPSEEFCRENHIKIIGNITFNSHLGTLNSNSLIIAREDMHYKSLFESLLQSITKEVNFETVTNS